MEEAEIWYFFTSYHYDCWRYMDLEKVEDVELPACWEVQTLNMNSASACI